MPDALVGSAGRDPAGDLDEGPQAHDTFVPLQRVGVDDAPRRAVRGAEASGRERAASQTNATFLQADAQTHALSPDQFDVVVSRFGTMFFDDPTTAFANIAGAARPGARLRLATWQSLAANDWLTIPGAALLRYGSLPEIPGAAPGMFAQSDRAVVARVLNAAGWHDIEVTPATVKMRLGADADAATRYLAATGIARSILDTIAEPDRPAAIDAVTTALEEHATPDGVSLNGGILLINARASV